VISLAKHPVAEWLDQVALLCRTGGRPIIASFIIHYTLRKLKHRGRMRRREFNALLVGLATSYIARPLIARAQKSAMPVVGFLNSGSAFTRTRPLIAFRQGLKEAGYVEGKNVTIEYRWAHGMTKRLPALAAELVQRQVSVIAAFGPPATAAAKKTGTAIPIVFLEALDPVKLGLVASLNHPGGNLTGVMTLNTGMGPKRLEVLHELIPTATEFAVLVNPTEPGNTETTVREVSAAAQKLGLKLHVLRASTDTDIDKVFAALDHQLRPAALVIGTDGFFIGHSKQLAALALRYKVPAIFQYREFVAAGGLMSYGSDIADTYRQIGAYAGRILKGQKPADLPIQQSTKMQLFINLKTAKAFSLTIPISLLGRADEMID
jgi:putative ABC transport system substrate-binding protein